MNLINIFRFFILHQQQLALQPLNPSLSFVVCYRVNDDAFVGLMVRHSNWLKMGPFLVPLWIKWLLTAATLCVILNLSMAMRNYCPITTCHEWVFLLVFCLLIVRRIIVLLPVIRKMNIYIFLHSLWQKHQCGDSNVAFISFQN